MSRARQATEAFKQIWADGKTCGHIHARRGFEILEKIEVDEARHRAFVLAVARAMRSGDTDAVIRLLDAEVTEMAKP